MTTIKRAPRPPTEPPPKTGVVRFRAPEAPRAPLGNARPFDKPRGVKPAPVTPAAPPAPNAQRLNKRMAELGMCSRREGDEWIARGWVKVNGLTAELGQMVTPDDRITTERDALLAQSEKATILLHKPVGYVSGQAEDGHEPAIVLIEPANRWRGDTSPRRFYGAQRRGLAPAGRLDIDSTGLLVLTQDGRVARQIIGETSELEKEYLVRVSLRAGQMDQPRKGLHNTLRSDEPREWMDRKAGFAAHTSRYEQKSQRSGPPLSGNQQAHGVMQAFPEINENVQAHFPPEQLQLLRHGLSLDGQALKPAKVDWQNPEQLRFVLTEGKNRQIRRMCEQVGLHVVGLKRIRIGNVVLGQLPVGQWRYLGAHEGF